MPNNYFQFKQFTIHQEKAGMKVCTDACLFGAFAAQLICENPIPLNHGKILDLGTGTGLLSLMIAQKTDTIIDAIEIDNDSFFQAKQNFENSSFGKRIEVFHGNAISHKYPWNYDLIISNPPFYEKHLLSANKNDRLARHSESLTILQLIEIVKANLKEKGYFLILMPSFRFNEVISVCHNYGLYVERQFQIHHSPKHESFRTIGVFRNEIKNEEERGSIFISDESNNYSTAFTNLLKDYYLYL